MLVLNISQNMQLKGEPRSPMLKQALNSIVQNVDSHTDPRRAIKKVVMKSLGERLCSPRDNASFAVFKTS